MKIIPYRKSKICAFFISLLFTGPGVIFYINPWKGILISIFEVFFMILFGPIPGFLIGVVLSVVVSFNTIDKERRIWYYNLYRSNPLALMGETCPDTLVIITTEDGLNKILKNITFENNLILNT
ncbi:MAG TPA: hypothetical protein EYP16_01915 [Candidatus Atribacteria bacterium]|nr:hypothetical protein [Candidatus Atribacteria bacterium]